MKFLFLARFSPDVKTVSQICREKTNQNNERIRVKTLLVEVRIFLNGYWETWQIRHHLRPGKAQFNSALGKADVTIFFLIKGGDGRS